MQMAQSPWSENVYSAPEIAASQPLPIVGLRATLTLPLEIAKKMAA